MPRSKRKQRGASQRKNSNGRAGGGVRPFWSGTIAFGLVSVPVNLFPAVRRTSPSLRMIDSDGTPLKRRYYCPEEHRDINSEHILRGYEYEPGEYVVVHDEELEKLAPKKSREIDVQRFVDRPQLPPILFDRPYYLTPSGDSNKAYRLLAEAMEENGRAGIATFVMRDREYLVAVLAQQGVLRLETLRFADEVRTAADVGLPEKQRPQRETVAEFEKAIEQHTSGRLDRSVLTDTRAARLRELVEEKVRSGQQVIDVSDDGAGEDSDQSGDGAATGSAELLDTIRQSIRRAAQSSDGDGRTGAAKKRLQNRTKDELYQQAQELKIPGRSRMNKDQLARAISDQR